MMWDVICKYKLDISETFIKHNSYNYINNVCFLIKNID